ncbi:MAG: T9SS type A sorting domain-containing protein [Bacteroidota bacterium]
MKKTIQKLRTAVLLIYLSFFTHALVVAQTMPDLGNDITICKGSSGTRTISITNKNNITEGTAPYRYSWLLLNGGEYTMLANGTVESLLNLEDYSLDISQIKSTSILRLEIIGSLNENNEISIYLFDDKEIIVQKPTVSLSSSTACENSNTFIYAQACNIDNSPYTYSYVYNDPLDNNYNTPITNTTEWMSDDTVVFFMPNYTNDVIDKEINIRVRIKDANNDIQESDILKVKVLNLGQPALQVFKYMCTDRVKLDLQLDGMVESELTFQWFRYYENGDSLILINDSVNSSLYANEAGYYQVIVSKTNNTDGTICTRASGRIKVINVGNVDPNIMAERNELYNTEDSILLSFTFPFDLFTLDLIHVQWYKNNLPIENANALTYYAKEQGNYRAVLFDICNEQTNSNPITLVQYITKTNEVLKNELFEVYPNPSKGIFTLECLNQVYLNEDVNIKIVDIYGKVISENIGKLFEKQTIDLKGKSDGIYFVNITLLKNNKESSIFKIIKTNN